MLEGGKHVLCEKPLGMNVKETKEMIQLARKEKLFLMEAVWSRFTPAYRKLKELIDNGNNSIIYKRSFNDKCTDVSLLCYMYITIFMHYLRCSGRCASDRCYIRPSD